MIFLCSVGWPSPLFRTVTKVHQSWRGIPFFLSGQQPGDREQDAVYSGKSSYKMGRFWLLAKLFFPRRWSEKADAAGLTVLCTVMWVFRTGWGLRWGKPEQNQGLKRDDNLQNCVEIFRVSYFWAKPYHSRCDYMLEVWETSSETKPKGKPGIWN